MEIKIKKGEESKWYTMPDTWDELNLGTYMNILKYLDDDKNPHRRTVMMIHYLTEIPENDIWAMSINHITEIGKLMTDLLESEANQELNHIIKIKGKAYGFHPKLRDITMGEFVDIESYINNDFGDNLHNILSILYRPVVKMEDDKYIIEEYEPSQQRAKLFKKHLTVADVMGATVFFYDLGKELIQTIGRSSPEMLKVMERALGKEKSQTNGGGTKLSTNLQMVN